MSKDEFQVGKTKLRLVKGDITELNTDVIVNAANSTLMGGGGVDGAIHRKGGPKILEECIQIRRTSYPEGLPPGKTVITSGGNLKAKNVIHAVGPVWQGGNNDEPDLLAQVYTNSMSIVVVSGLKSVAFPSIGTGAYGYPIEEASRIAIKTVKQFLENEDRLDEVVFVLFSEKDLSVYRLALAEAF